MGTAYFNAKVTEDVRSSVSGISNNTSIPTVPSSMPGLSNTGYQNAPGYPGSPSLLTDGSALTLTSNTTYNNYNFPHGPPTISVNNVTFVGCRFAIDPGDSSIGVHLDTGSNGTLFSYCTIESNAYAAGYGQANQADPYATPIPHNNGLWSPLWQPQNTSFTFDHGEIWGFAEGINMGFSSQALPVTISNSWIHNCRNDGGVDHSEAIYTNDGCAYLTISNCNLIGGNGNNQDLAAEQTSKPHDHLTVTGCYFSGYGYMVCVGGSAYGNNTFTVFTNNHWSTEFEPGFGPVFDYTMFTTSGLGSHWAGNTYRISPVQQTAWLNSTFDGTKWWPTDQNPSSPSDLTYYHGSTDYTNP